MKAETHLASWQVICPDGAYAGGVAVAPPIVMAQAVDQSAPVPTVMAQAMDPSASVPLGVVMSPQQQMGTAMAQPMVMAPQGVAPVNNTMARGPMDGRMSEVSSGCYYHKNAPCCFLFLQRGPLDLHDRPRLLLLRLLLPLPTGLLRQPKRGVAGLVGL